MLSRWLELGAVRGSTRNASGVSLEQNRVEQKAGFTAQVDRM